MVYSLCFTHINFYKTRQSILGSYSLTQSDVWLLSECSLNAPLMLSKSALELTNKKKIESSWQTRNLWMNRQTNEQTNRQGLVFLRLKLEPKIICKLFIKVYKIAFTYLINHKLQGNCLYNTVKIIVYNAPEKYVVNYKVKYHCFTRKWATLSLFPVLSSATDFTLGPICKMWAALMLLSATNWPISYLCSNIYNNAQN